MRIVKLSELEASTPEFKTPRGVGPKKPQCVYCSQWNSEHTVKVSDRGRAHQSCANEVNREALALAKQIQCPTPAVK